MSGPPSTQWQEDVAPDEEERFGRYAEVLRDIQRRENRKGAGRALHRKTNLAARAKVEILGDLPGEAAVGIAAQPRTYEAYVRFSNGVHRTQSDSLPDLRGLAVKLLGVGGRKVIPGLEDAQTQDFLAINSASLPFAHVDDFMRFVHAADPPVLALPRMLKAFGPRRTASLLAHLRRLGPPASLASIRYHSAAPVKWGDYAAKYAFLPIATGGDDRKVKGSNRLGRGLAERLSRHDVGFDFAIQLYRDPVRTPIEDVSVEWDEHHAPLVTIGRLTVPRQDVDSQEGRELTERIDSLSFDPWHALEAHRPLGNIMRARSKAYYASIVEREAAPEPVT